MEQNVDRSGWNGLRPLDIVKKSKGGIETGPYIVMKLHSDEERVFISKDGSNATTEVFYSFDLTLIDKIEDRTKDNFEVYDCCCDKGKIRP
jgi:hypothetical protein